jgi:hypothetical protein
MRKLTFLHKDSGSGENGCPAAYGLSDGSIAIQGVTMTDPGELAQVRDLDDGESVVVIPANIIHQFVERS